MQERYPDLGQSIAVELSKQITRFCLAFDVTNTCNTFKPLASRRRASGTVVRRLSLRMRLESSCRPAQSNERMLDDRRVLYKESN